MYCLLSETILHPFTWYSDAESSPSISTHIYYVMFHIFWGRCASLMAWCDYSSQWKLIDTWKQSSSHGVTDCSSSWWISFAAPWLLFLKRSRMVKLASASLQTWLDFTQFHWTNWGITSKGHYSWSRNYEHDLSKTWSGHNLDGSKLFLTISLSSSSILINCILYHK